MITKALPDPLASRRSGTRSLRIAPKRYPITSQGDASKRCVGWRRAQRGPTSRARRSRNPKPCNVGPRFAWPNLQTHRAPRSSLVLRRLAPSAARPNVARLSAPHRSTPMRARAANLSPSPLVGSGGERLSVAGGSRCSLEPERSEGRLGRGGENSPQGLRPSPPARPSLRSGSPGLKRPPGD